MKPKELENLTKSIGLNGEVDDCVLGSLYATYRNSPYHCVTLVYMPGGKDKNVYIADKLEWYLYQGNLKEPLYLIRYKYLEKFNITNMTMIYPKYKMTDDEQIKLALGNLAKELKSIQCEIKKHQMGVDFNGSKI